MYRTTNGFALALLLAAALSAAATPPRRAPKVGDVQQVDVITVSLAVGSTGKEVKRVTYAPPPGWYVRGHRVECKEKTGLSAFTVNTLPRDWTYMSEEHVNESYKALFDLAGQAADAAAARAKLAAEQERTLAEVRQGRSSHHVLVVEAAARGEGWLRGGGTLTLTVTADLVYVGTAEELSQAVAEAKGR